jgi:hypothetical protein
VLAVHFEIRASGNTHIVLQRDKLGIPYLYLPEHHQFRLDSRFGAIEIQTARLTIGPIVDAE